MKSPPLKRIPHWHSATERPTHTADSKFRRAAPRTFPKSNRSGAVSFVGADTPAVTSVTCAGVPERHGPWARPPSSSTMPASCVFHPPASPDRRRSISGRTMAHRSAEVGGGGVRGINPGRAAAQWDCRTRQPGLPL